MLHGVILYNLKMGGCGAWCLSYDDAWKIKSVPFAFMTTYGVGIFFIWKSLRNLKLYFKTAPMKICTNSANFTPSRFIFHVPTENGEPGYGYSWPAFFFWTLTNWLSSVLRVGSLLRAQPSRVHHSWCLTSRFQLLAHVVWIGLLKADWQGY
jgi:hypothetical protein